LPVQQNLQTGGNDVKKALAVTTKKMDPPAAAGEGRVDDLFSDDGYGSVRDRIKGKLLAVTSSAQNVMEQTAMTYWDIGRSLAEYIVGPERKIETAKDREEVMARIPGPLLARLTNDLNNENLAAAVSDSLLRGMVRMSITFTQPQMVDAIVVSKLAHSHMDALASVADDDARSKLLEAAKKIGPSGRRMSVDALKGEIGSLPPSKLTPDSQVQRQRVKSTQANKLKDTVSTTSKLYGKIRKFVTPTMTQLKTSLAHVGAIPDERLPRAAEALEQLAVELENSRQAVEAVAKAAAEALKRVRERQKSARK